MTPKPKIPCRECNGRKLMSFTAGADFRQPCDTCNGTGHGYCQERLAAPIVIQCSRPATVINRDTGKRYCTFHDPERRKMRREKLNA